MSDLINPIVKLVDGISLMKQIEKLICEFQIKTGTCPSFIWQNVKEMAEEKLSIGSINSKMELNIKARKLGVR